MILSLRIRAAGLNLQAIQKFARAPDDPSPISNSEARPTIQLLVTQSSTGMSPTANTRGKR